MIETPVFICFVILQRLYAKFVVGLHVFYTFFDYKVNMVVCL